MREDKESFDSRPLGLKDADIYNFGQIRIMRTPKSLAKIKTLPTIDLKSRSEILKFWAEFEKQIKIIMLQVELKVQLLVFLLLKIYYQI